MEILPFQNAYHQITRFLQWTILFSLITGCVFGGKGASKEGGTSQGGAASVSTCIFCTTKYLVKLEKAASEQNVNIDNRSKSNVLRRASLVKEYIDKAKILWVDDIPENNDSERNLLGSLGLTIDLARNNQLALEKIQQNAYNVVLSDMRREDIPDAGVKLLAKMREKQIFVPLIFYIQSFDPQRGTPPFSVGITNRPDELIHLILDVLERSLI